MCLVPSVCVCVCVCLCAVCLAFNPSNEPNTSPKGQCLGKYPVWSLFRSFVRSFFLSVCVALSIHRMNQTQLHAIETKQKQQRNDQDGGDAVGELDALLGSLDRVVVDLGSKYMLTTSSNV